MTEARETKVLYSKSASLWMALGVALVLSLLAVLQFRGFQAIENQFIDFRFAVRGERPSGAPIAVVAVDEKSLQEIGRWPWSRSVHADLARRLKADGAKFAFYDFIFSEPEQDPTRSLMRDLEKTIASSEGGEKARQEGDKLRTEISRIRGLQTGDEKFSKALRDVGNVFIPITPLGTDEGRTPDAAALHTTFAQSDHPLGPDEFETASSLMVAIPSLQNNVLDSGHIRFFPDFDGVLRYYPTVIRYKKVLLPHAALQMARHVLGVETPVKVGDGFVLVGDRKIPTHEGGYALIDYCGKKENAFPNYSASDVLSGKVGKAELDGKVVLIGATADGLFDLRPTPFTKAFPGVEINANILENVVSGRFLRLAPDAVTYLLILVFAFLMWWIVPRWSPVKSAAWFAVLLAATVVAACLLFNRALVVVNMVYPLVALALTYTILTVYKFRTEVRHSRYIKQMFQSMVAPTVVDEILKLPSGIELGGEEKELTVMFSDVRGFTTYSESHTPHEVVSILNEYLTQMTYLVFQTEGTLDKYIGDAIMAFWGAPTPQSNHAFRACSTALRMVEMLKGVLHPKWELEGREKLCIGIGLNTGKMVVGFVGSENIKNYTLIGDAVNLASRLEGATKEYKADILIGEGTYEAVKDDMLCRELDLIRVKGKLQPVRLYELVALKGKAESNLELKVKAFEEGLAEYRSRRFDAAEVHFRNCLALDPQDGPAQVFLNRCPLLKEADLPEDWDGVFIMKTK